ncbi:MAG: Fe-S cluster assembly protein SufD, partial [Bacteroidia bacterium]
NEAIGVLSEIELPTIRSEAWRYSSLRDLLAMNLRPAAAVPMVEYAPYDIAGLDADRIVFVNGQYQPGLSDIQNSTDELCVCQLKDLEGDGPCLAAFEAHFAELATAEKDIFTALNNAYASEGLVIRVKRNQQVSRPVHILHINEGEADFYTQIRNLLVVEPGAEVKIVESFVGEGRAFRNHVTEIIVGENAGCEWVKLQHEDDSAALIDRTEVKQSNDSRCTVFTLTFSGGLVRNNFHLHLDGQNTESHIMGLSLLDQNQHVDNFTSIDHRQPNCFSNELYKGIYNDSASGAFRGRIHVFPDAQKTNAYQSNRNILLSDEASIDTKPQLEIYADDVKCSHGATTGRIDKDALFYLRARGIPELEANKLMIQAFAGEVSQEISMEAVREHVESLIARRF